MRLSILGDPNGWYVRDLLRASTDFPKLHEAVAVPFQQIACRIGGNPPTSSVESPTTWHIDRDLVLVRGMPLGSLEQVIFRMDALAAWHHAGGMIVNSPRSLEVAIDKYLSLCRLQRAGLLVPQTVVTQSVPIAMAALEEMGDVVVKPIFGSEGRGMIRISDTEIGYRVFQTLARTGSVLYLQQFVPNRGGDIRLLVVGNCVLGMRRWCQGDWRANVARGARCEVFTVSSEWEVWAHQAVTAIGAEIAAVDCLEGDDGAHYCLEVNGVPGWRGLARTLDVDVASLIVKFLCERWEAR